MDKLRVHQLEAGFLGRTVAVLGRPVGELPPTQISTGDIVAVHSAATSQPDASDPGEDEEKPPSGVVTRLTATAVHVAFDGDDAARVDALDGPVRLAKLANDVTFRRYAQALSTLRTARQAPCQSVIDMCGRRAIPTGPSAHATGPLLRVAAYFAGATSPCPAQWSPFPRTRR